MALNKWTKIKWVEALRSGNYRQTRGKLLAKDKDGNLCHDVLGVLLEVLEYPKDVDRLIFKHNHGYLHFGLGGSTELTVTEESTITNLSDTQQKTFAEIADYIEANILESSTA